MTEEAPGAAKPRIGFVGLGNMGNPMSMQLMLAGYELICFDISDEALQEVVDAGATGAGSAADVAANCDVFCTSLPRPDHVLAVMSGDSGALSALRSGTVWVDFTTNRGNLVRRLADQAPAGVKVVDAPVTGAVDGARTGTLTLFMGGDRDAVDRVQPLLETLGLTVRCGPLGTGNVVKLVTNQLWFVHAAALGEGFALGMANGVDLETLWYAIKESVGDSFVARHDAPSIFAGHYDPSFTLELCLKDLALTAELAQNVGTDLPMTEAAHRTFDRAAERYGAEKGELFVAKRIEDDARLSFRLVGDWVPHWEK